VVHLRKVAETGLPLFKQVPKLKKGQRFKTVTENVEQGYTVTVPYTEVVDGKEIQRFRSEKRNRKVPMTKKIVVDEFGKEVDKSEIEMKPMMKRHAKTYSVKVPYTEIVDGISVSKTRTEVRTYDIKLPVGYKHKEVIIGNTCTYKAASVTGFDVHGEAISEQEVVKRLADPQPVIIVSDRSSISPFFEHVLRPETMFFVLQQKGILGVSSTKE